MIKKLHVKTGDTVMVKSGKYKNKTGKIIAVSVDEGKVIVEGIAIKTKHVKPKRQGEVGGIIKAEGALYASKVLLYCDKCKTGRRYKNTKAENGDRIRVCSKCGATM